MHTGLGLQAILIGFIAANRLQVIAFAVHAHFHYDGAMRGVRAVRGGVLEGVGTVALVVLQVVANLRRVLRHIG